MASASGLPIPGAPPEMGETLRTIERNTAETVRWLRYLVGAVIVLIVVTALVLV